MGGPSFLLFCKHTKSCISRVLFVCCIFSAYCVFGHNPGPSSIYISCKGPLSLPAYQFSKVRWSGGPQRGAVVQIWSYERIPDCDHWFPISSSECTKCPPRHRSGL